MKTKYLIFGLLILLIACKKNEKISFDNLFKTNKDSLVNKDEKFDKTNFKDRAEELIYIREYLKYKLPRIIVEKDPELARKAQYLLIAKGENPSLLEAVEKGITYSDIYTSIMATIISKNTSFKDVKKLLETKFKTSNKIGIIENKDYYQQERENNEPIVDEPVETDSNNDNNYNGQGTGKGIEGNPLGGRKTLIKPNPKYNCNEQGTVIVEILVDKGGNVIDVKTGLKGTTNNSKCLLDACKEAALNTKWEANENAPDKQIGSITYDFKISD